MPFTITQKKTIPYVEQITEFYCGPASALMMLGFLGVLVANTEDEKKDHQDVLFERADKINWGKSLEDEAPEDWEDWVTTPQEMVNMLHFADSDAQQVNLWIQYFASGGPDNNRGNFLAALRAITKDETEKPPAAVPVHNYSHWVVLAQYAENATADGQVFKSFSGKDPIYYNNETATNSAESSSYQGTINLADNPLNFEPQANLLLIRETENDDSVDNAVIRRAIVVNPAAPINLPPNPISPAAAPKVALQRLKEFGVTTPCLSGTHLNGTVPGIPFRVKRLDRPDGARDYYLIGMQNANSKENRMLVRLDILTGSYLDSLTIPPTKYLLDKPRLDVDLVEHVKSLIDFYQRSPKTRQRWKDALQRVFASSETVLVWRPCEESPSAFYPFYEIKENNRTLFYVRIDGQIFYHLSTMCKPQSQPLPSPQPILQPLPQPIAPPIPQPPLP
jgi:hypothetical protein